MAAVLSHAPDVQYNLRVVTANTTAAGIGKTIFLKLYGASGSTRPIELGDKNKRITKSRRSPFAKDTTSYFVFKREDIGDITDVEVWHNGETSWGLEVLEIQKGSDLWTFVPSAPIPNEKQKENGAQMPRFKRDHSMVDVGGTRLHTAAKYGKYKELEDILLNNDYDVDVPDKLGRTPAHYACLYGQPESLRTLLERGCNIGKRDNYGKHCLHHACLNHNRNQEIVDILLQHAPSPQGQQDGQDGKATEYSEKQKLEIFIRDQDNYGKTPLHYAATYGFDHLVRVLERHGKTVDERDKNKQTPLFSAAIQGESKVALTLIELGADFKHQDKDNKTFLHHAASAGHAKFFKEVMDTSVRRELRDALTKLLEVRDLGGRTPFLCACLDGQYETVAALYHLKSDIFAKDEDGNTALHCAAVKGTTKLMAYLNQKLDLNAVNAFLCTPLHIAVHNNNGRVVRWLLDQHVDLTIKNVTGETALEIAKDKNFEHLTRALNNAHVMQSELLASEAKSMKTAAGGGAGSGSSPDAGGVGSGGADGSGGAGSGGGLILGPDGTVLGTMDGGGGGESAVPRSQMVVYGEDGKPLVMNLDQEELQPMPFFGPDVGDEPDPTLRSKFMSLQQQVDILKRKLKAKEAEVRAYERMYGPLSSTAMGGAGAGTADAPETNGSRDALLGSSSSYALMSTNPQTRQQRQGQSRACTNQQGECVVM